MNEFQLLSGLYNKNLNKHKDNLCKNYVTAPGYQTKKGKGLTLKGLLLMVIV